MLASADLGLSGVDYVIAETRTLGSWPEPARCGCLTPTARARGRSTSLQVIATLADYLLLAQAAEADPQQYLTSCVSFVTGPSRTGDIRAEAYCWCAWAWGTASRGLDDSDTLGGGGRTLAALRYDRHRGKIQHLATQKPEVHRARTPGPVRKDRGLPAATPLAAAPVTATVAIGTLLLRPSFIHDQGPPRKLRTMQRLDGLLRLSRRTHIDKTKAPRLPSIFIGNDAGGFDCAMCCRRAPGAVLLLLNRANHQHITSDPCSSPKH